MYVNEHKDFDPQFPEQFNWPIVAQTRMEVTAERIIREIEKDLETSERVYVPGLRKALVIMAGVATTDWN